MFPFRVGARASFRFRLALALARGECGAAAFGRQLERDTDLARGTGRVVRKVPLHDRFERRLAQLPRPAQHARVADRSSRI
jgi:hypothetical protein